MTTPPPPDNQVDGSGPAPGQNPPGGRGQDRRKRRIITSTIALTVVLLLLGNAVLVSRQDADATGEEILDLDGGAIHVSQDGPRDGRALVLIHGLGASTRWWDRIVPTLAGTYRVIRLDLLGHGRSAKPAGDGYPIPEQGHRIGQALDRLGIGRAILVGHSTGGYVVTSLAEQRGDLVAGLALVNTGPRADSFLADEPVGRLIEVPVLGQLLWRFRTDGVLRQGLSSAFAPGFEIPQQFVDDARTLTYHSLTAASRASDDYLDQRPVPDRLSALGKPVLVLFGEEDQRWRSSSAELYGAVAGAEVKLLPGVGHSPMVEDPTRTAELLLTFAGSVPDGR